jgi:hypothetical protein
MAQLEINAVAAGCDYRIGWVSLQSDDSVSVGLAARTFISPRFHARQDLWNVDNRVAVQYLVPHMPEELRPVRNPHLTFHPPITFHLRANGDELLFEGIADVDVMLAEDSRVPWIRFVSGPVSELARAGAPRNPNTSALRVPVESTDVSLGIAVDFIRPGTSEASGRIVDHFVDVGQSRLHIFAEVLAGRQSTLAWYHQY